MAVPKQAAKKASKKAEQPPAPISDAVLSVDIGGSGLKLRVLSATGEPLTERLRVETPVPAEPEPVLAALLGLIAQVDVPFGKVAVGFPGVVRQGVIGTAVNLHPDWVGLELGSELEKQLKCPVRVANDADIQGYGAIKGHGLEMVITLGTGLGAALFIDGVLVPNLELGHHPFRKGETYEQQLGRLALDTVGKKRWSKRLVKALDLLQRIFNFDMLYLGGGNAKKLDPTLLPPYVKVISNDAGILGGTALWR